MDTKRVPLFLVWDTHHKGREAKLGIGGITLDAKRVLHSPGLDTSKPKQGSGFLLRVFFLWRYQA